MAGDDVGCVRGPCDTQIIDTANTAKLDSKDAQQTQLSKQMAKIAQNIEGAGANLTGCKVKVATMKAITDYFNKKFQRLSGWAERNRYASCVVSQSSGQHASTPAVVSETGEESASKKMRNETEPAASSVGVAKGQRARGHNSPDANMGGSQCHE